MKTTKKKRSVFAGIMLDVLLVLIVLLVALAVITGKAKGKVVYLFGYANLWVETGSMETTIPAGSYILVKKAKEVDPASLDGQIITFHCTDTTSEAYGKLITHRVCAVTPEGLKTKGDNVLCNVDPWTVDPKDIEAVYVRNMNLLSTFGRLFASGFGLMLIIGLFTFTCAAFFIPDIIKGLKEPDDPEEAAREKEEEMTRRIREEVERLKRENAPPPPAEKGEPQPTAPAQPSEASDPAQPTPPDPSQNGTPE